MQPPSRRTFLALGLLTLTACTADHPGPTPGTGGLRPDPDTPVRLRALAATDALLAGYDALAQNPGLRAETALHRAALAEGLSPSATPSPTADPAPVDLAALELRTADAHLADLDAAGPSLARLLASVAAANTLHATILGAPVPPPPARPTTATTATPTPAAALTALQNALAAEHAAVYGYGVVGARLPADPQRADARTAYAAHQAQRDTWQRLLTTLGTTPSPAAAGYQLPFPVTSPTDATKLATHLETRLTTVYADLVAAVPTPHRLPAAQALRDTTLRAHHWGAPTTPFPGIPTT
ncbi:ferritin-like domain-containing protein [Kitasatospora sp. NPDC093550]|uniref:ferritin-like domain-containing protein n=1 Tax=Kitasatospora sp. NPDC093550 TaxID=3364089 RepID=UPI003807A331